MRLAKYKESPWRALEDLHDEINELFDFSLRKPLIVNDEILVPSVDIYEDKDNIYVDANVPGFEQKDISVSLREGSLSISAKREENKEEKKKGYLRRERFHGRFYRALSLPAAVDENKIKANYKNGVLKVVLPKKEEEEAGEVKIAVE